MIKAAFFDIDGTLLSHRTNRVPASARAALQELRRRGILVFLATGRHVAMLEVLPQLDGIEYDGSITINGQYCFNAQQVLYSRPICRDDIALLLSHIEKNPMPCVFLEERTMYINFSNERVERVHAAIHSPIPEPGDLRRGYDHDIYQVLLYLSDDEIRQLPAFAHTKTTKWHDGGIDLLPATGGKNIGINKILQHYGISKEESIGFGDGENDIDMFHAVGTAVAMGNAGEKVKKESDYVTCDIDEDGIANALRHFGII